MKFFHESLSDSHVAQVADIQPAIIETFGDIKDLPWIGVAFSLGAISILPL